MLLLLPNVVSMLLYGNAEWKDRIAVVFTPYLFHYAFKTKTVYHKRNNDIGIMFHFVSLLFFVPPFIDICLVLYAWNENTNMLWSDKALLTKYKLSFVEIHA